MGGWPPPAIGSAARRPGHCGGVHTTQIPTSPTLRVGAEVACTRPKTGHSPFFSGDQPVTSPHGGRAQPPTGTCHKDSVKQPKCLFVTFGTGRCVFLPNPPTGRGFRPEPGFDIRAGEGAGPSLRSSGGGDNPNQHKDVVRVTEIRPKISAPPKRPFRALFFLGKDLPNMPKIFGAKYRN